MTVQNIKMDSKDELKEIDIKKRTSQYYIIKFWGHRYWFK